MRECERVWLDLPEGSRIGRRFAAAWRGKFSGTGGKPSAKEEQLIEFWPQGQLRALRSAMAQLYYDVYHEAWNVHTHIEKSNVITEGQHRITIDISDELLLDPGEEDIGTHEKRHRNITITFHHYDFGYVDLAAVDPDVRPWQIECEDA